MTEPPFRDVTEIGLHPDSEKEGLLIDELDKIKGRGGKTEYLHMLLNRGLFVLRQKIKELQDKGMGEKEVLEHFSENATLYRVAFLYFESIKNLESSGGQSQIPPNKVADRRPPSLSDSDTDKNIPGDDVSEFPTTIPEVREETKPAGKGRWSTLKSLATGNAEANNE